MNQSYKNNLTTQTKKSSYFKPKDPAKFIEDFIEYYSINFGKLKKFGKGWLILCPFHADNDPSLAIYKDGGCFCFACKEPKKLAAVYKAYNFWIEGPEPEESSLKPHFEEKNKENQDWIIIDQKQYLYSDGERSFVRIRIDFENTKTKQRKKSFYFYQKVFRNGKEDLELVRGYVPLILYNLTFLENAEMVFFVEGEKCADALLDLGLVATTLPIGAHTKINKEIIQALMPLQMKKVFIFPDNDKPGKTFAKNIQKALETIKAKAQIIEIPELWEKADIADYVELQLTQGKTKEEIKEEILSWCKIKEEIINPVEEEREEEKKEDQEIQIQELKQLIWNLEKMYTQKPKNSLLLALALKIKCNFWLSDFEEPFISLNKFKHMRIESKAFKDYLQDLSFKCFNEALYREAMEENLSLFRFWARESKLKFPVFTRVGYSIEGNFIEVNLLREDNKVLRITKDDIELDLPRLKFITPKTQLPLRFNLDLLRSMQNKNFTADEILELFSQVFNIRTKEELALLIAWAIKIFYPIGEYPILAVLGEREGVGKTTFSKFLNQLLDPSVVPLKTFPKNRDDLFVLAKEDFLLVFDNLSYIDEDMSDALCQLATGGSLSKRKLYTDYEVINMPIKRPVVINSIFNVMQRRDLRRRSIILELKKPTKTKSLKELQEDFNRLAPMMFSYIVLCVQEALKEKTIDLPLLDLADFCEWVAKAHPVFFMEGREFIQTLKANREEIAKEVLESSLLVPIIEEKTATLGIWQTTAKELLEILRAKYPNEKSLPSTVEKLGRELKKIASDLEALGIKVEFIRTPKKRLIVFYKEVEQPKEPS
jgi:5S rRNA maturation endonuclease (ribonuclease M5)